MEKIDLRSRNSIAKVLGTMVSILGAFVVTLYDGLPIIITQPSSFSLHQPLSSLKSNWVIGGLLLTADNILLPLWYIVQVGFFHITQKPSLSKLHEICKYCRNETSHKAVLFYLQAQIMKEYPSELTVVFFYNLCVSIIALVVGLITEEDSNSWRLEPKIALVSVVCSVRS